LDPVDDGASLREWTPVWIRTGAEPAVDWAIVAAPFTEPFFEQSADRAMRHPFNRVFARTTPLDVLRALGTREPALAPNGFIFHMSRCGSTLVAQMLAALPDTVVLSEAQPLDAIVTLHRAGRLAGDDAVALLRGAVSALGRPRRGERRLFVKFHASHVVELPLIARAFPNVPWVFLYREPRAVLQSHAETQGAETFPETVAPASIGVDPSEARNMHADEYGARVLAAFCRAALRNAENGSPLFVDYARLPEAVLTEILPFFGVALEDGVADRLHAVSRRDTKQLGDFQPRTHPAAAPRIDRLATRWLDAEYAALGERSVLR
jgi:hypothetical protein